MTSAIESTGKLNKFEKFKAEKDGLAVKAEIEAFGRIGWEAIDETDRNHRLKWLGIFFRPVTPGKFMLRLRMPNGIITSEQMTVLGEIVQRYGDDGNADITTRQNLQLRGIRIEDIPDIFQRMQQVGLTSVQSGMDNVRNITGSPVAGLDADELYDTRELVQQVQDMITNSSEGNPEFTNLPRKFNIAIAGCRDNSVHAEINDIAFVPAFKGEMFGFNVLVGGFFSARRCEAAIPLKAWVLPEQVVAVCRGILEVYRDHGPRANRQKSRLMWLIDEWGLDKFRAEVEQQIGQTLEPEAEKDEILWDKRDHIGIYPQKQSGLNYAGLLVPIGRLYAEEMFGLAQLASVYGNGEIRLTVEQNLIIPNIPDSRLETFLTEPLLEKFSINPASLTRALVSCTGAQFCNFALIETKNRALAMAQELESELAIPQPVRMHWTGCPNSCGQPQVAAIGLMGTKVRKNGKTVEGVDLYMGGTVGKDAHLGTCVRKGIACEDLKPVLREILIEQFGAEPLNGTINGATDSTMEVISSTVEGDHSDPELKAAAASAILVFAKSGKEIDCSAADSILDIADQGGIEIDSSCRSGTCGTCMQRVVQGEVCYEGEPEALTEGDRQQGQILTCIARPIGRVVIDL
ncbi:MAG: ferredoxin--nitrite reductase [Oscillatoriales cyanobacterium RM2_1_1]|nr:ferredoxin--nitrite reductase [Oscillatoriales cyanobacterium SM2_3_0]NJO47572.1 ferredoxin--nitrite reductase [Oscillatoriales cyanobacterium RM2_1_1]